MIVFLSNYISQFSLIRFNYFEKVLYFNNLKLRREAFLNILVSCITNGAGNYNKYLCLSKMICILSIHNLFVKDIVDFFSQVDDSEVKFDFLILVSILVFTSLASFQFK